MGDQLYQFTCLPNGLAEAPRKFTKILKVPFTKLREQGHVSSAYLDDSALFGLTEESCNENIHDTMTLMDSLGFTIHPEKSVLQPGHTLIYLGFILDSIDMTVSLTEERKNKIIHCCQKLLEGGQVTIRHVAEAVGLMVAAEPGVDFAPVYYRRIDNFKAACLKKKGGNFEAPITLTREISTDLTWWIRHISSSAKKLYRHAPDIYVTSDSSDWAWGGARDGTTTGGPWDHAECTWHINVKELMAAFLTLRALCGEVKDTHVRLGTDNTTTLAYINKQGGRKSDLNEIAREIWIWAIDRNIWLSAVHVPGVANVAADTASRKKYEHEGEWKLNEKIFKMIEDKVGQFQIDLFASRINTQCKQFFAWQPDPDALAIDAFSHPWSFDNMYAFPPFSLIGRLLEEVERQGVDVWTVLPLWPSQPWFPRALRLLTRPPALLPRVYQTLYLPQKPQEVHSLEKKLKLTLFCLSGKVCKQEDFLQKLPPSLSVHGERTLKFSTKGTSKSGFCFVTKGKLIQCTFLNAM